MTQEILLRSTDVKVHPQPAANEREKKDEGSSNNGKLVIPRSYAQQAEDAAGGSFDEAPRKSDAKTYRRVNTAPAPAIAPIRVTKTSTDDAGSAKIEIAPVRRERFGFNSALDDDEEEDTDDAAAAADVEQGADEESYQKTSEQETKAKFHETYM